MSADNYYMVRRAVGGGFVALMGFASDDRAPTPPAPSVQLSGRT